MSPPFPLLTLQPISDTHNAWVALLLESEPACDGNVLTRIFGEFGLGEALGDLPCVASLPDLPDGVEALPAGQVLLLPMAVCCDRGNDERLQALHASGFRLMAAGLHVAGQTPSEAVDALALSCPGPRIPAEMAALLAKLPGPHLALHAAQIVCPGRCHFQWLARRAGVGAVKPAPGKGSDAPNRLLLLELLSQVANDADSHAIEKTIKHDPQLSYHLLKLVNSVAFSLTTKIASFNQAITLLGRRQLQRWLQLLLYARADSGEMANPLLPMAAMRAGLTEALCTAQGGSRDDQDRAFMVGMFSLLDVLFGMPIADIVKPLNLTEDVHAALTERSGPLGILLRTVEAGEGSPGAELAALLKDAAVSNDDWARSVIRAARWAIQISREA